MIKSSEDIGLIVRKVRKHLGITQSDLALTAGTGVRFIIELEQGKPGCEVAKVLDVLQTLGIQCRLSHTEVDCDEP